MRILGIIPARFASTRFPGKPLAPIAGKTMIQRVYEQASQSASLVDVIVATDDERIYDAVSAFGGRAVMTDPVHPSGTDRCAEALHASGIISDAVINIQGDEPFISPHQIDLVADVLKQGQFSIATLVKVIQDETELFSPNIPKVVLDFDGSALYFSRQAIPHLRGVPESQWLGSHRFFKHIGIYGYTAEVLPQLTKLEQGILEKAESLEQLRWLEHGLRIGTRVTDLETVSVDVPADIERAEALLKAY